MLSKSLNNKLLKSYLFKSTTITNSCQHVTEQCPRGGYRKHPLPGFSIANAFKGYKLLPKVIKDTKQILYEEQFVDTDFISVHHRDYRYFAKFREMSDEAMNNWLITTDKDHGEGNSTAWIERNPKLNTILFKGNLDIEPMKKGDLVRTGYVNLRSPRRIVLGVYEIGYKYFGYNHIILRYRGDGRTYNLLIKRKPTFDYETFDMFTYPLFTRGGPYWQTVKIPLSKFIYSYRGRIQDRQYAADVNLFREFSITLADKKTGPFCLELDYLAFSTDLLHRETTAYEKYFASSQSKLY